MIVAGPGLAVADPATALIAVGEVLLVALLHATAPFVVATKLADVPSLGTITLSLSVVGVAYLPFALLTQHEAPTLRSGLSLAALGIFCTAVAFRLSAGAHRVLAGRHGRAPAPRRPAGAARAGHEPLTRPASATQTRA
ncbi:hypothetical protein [Microbacterium lacticum]